MSGVKPLILAFRLPAPLSKRRATSSRTRDWAGVSSDPSFRGKPRRRSAIVIVSLNGNTLWTLPRY
jgi:hypothetical protein